MAFEVILRIMNIWIQKKLYNEDFITYVILLLNVQFNPVISSFINAPFIEH
jgi:hypothetical protein